MPAGGGWKEEHGREVAGRRLCESTEHCTVPPKHWCEADPEHRTPVRSVSCHTVSSDLKVVVLEILPLPVFTLLKLKQKESWDSAVPCLDCAFH